MFAPRTVLPELVGDREAILVADQRVLELHGAPIDCPRVELEASEANKTIDTWRAILDCFVAEGLDRDAVVVAFGGGVVLDMAGFAAASYLRGVNWISVPSTLLAQVDAAHGGKTGVDHPAAKNLVGAFHMPEEVLVDATLLATLPDREVRGGLAEVVKHGVIAAPSLLERAGRDDPADFVEEAAQVKLDIVARDPREQGERRKLNLGHTLGHAIEQASGYRLHHGEAVALGLRAACFIAERHCGFEQTAAVAEALDRCGLPDRTDVEEDAVLDALRHDKKRRGKTLRWALPVTLGDVRIYDDVRDDLVREALRRTMRH